MFTRRKFFRRGEFVSVKSAPQSHAGRAPGAEAPTEQFVFFMVEFYPYAADPPRRYCGRALFRGGLLEG